MTDNITPIHKDPVDGMKGIQQSGWSVVIEGREIPRLLMYERGDQITLVLDKRFGIDVPRMLAHSVAWLIANALAIGEGYPVLSAPTKDRPFAPEMRGLSLPLQDHPE